MKLFAAILACLPLVASAAAGDSFGDEAEAARSQIEKSIQSLLGSVKVKSAVTGTVTHVGQDFIFMQDGDSAIKVFLVGAAFPRVGDVVSAAVKPSLEGGRVVFAASKWTRISTAPLPAPRPASADDLVFVAATRAERARDVNWRRVEVRGRAVGLTESGFAMDVGDMPVTVVVRKVPSFLSDCAATRPIVRVVGVAELVLDQSALAGRVKWVMGVKVHISGADDVAIEPDLIYLANRRDRRVRIGVVAAFSLLGLLVVVLAVHILRQSRRRLRSQVIAGERKRMADDLHDTIEQHLVGAGMLLQLDRRKEAVEILQRAKREMRDIVWGLKNDDMMRLTPSEMIREYVRSENRKGVYRIDCRLAGLPEHLDAQAMRDLSLIVREAVGNAVKHGRARKIAIAAEECGEGGWRLRISNDGAPFDPANAPGVEEGHFGIEGMKARARRLGAKLSIGASDGRTVLELETEK